jgi:hypothetical protein
MLITVGSYKLHRTYNIIADIWQYTAGVHTKCTWRVAVQLLTHRVWHVTKLHKHGKYRENPGQVKLNFLCHC